MSGFLRRVIAALADRRAPVVTTLTAGEIAAFRAMSAQAKAAGVHPQLGPNLADLLRAALPDLDDITIGRVTAVLAGHTGRIVEINPTCGVLETTSNQIALAAADLTAIEWQERPS